MTFKSARPTLLFILIALSAGLASGLVFAAQERPALTPETRAKLITAARACRPDMKRHCANVERGEGRILQCLKAHQSQLAPDCVSAMQALRTP
ncbi:cysteine rich repeat-containing protein [Rhizobium sp. AAP43]|uniref:cysteine rich repeat-containing protein n=1 Tax=Rhizobium sp. AAP43 TaxID=1523420 RepID=UPI0006B9CEB2|nr:cysteine rich repeat-containing protein [Rhizobium sp. AAP43]KPF46898.1 hypothetical protein IP76_03265 [Rhizobium sp. AAP43]